MQIQFAARPTLAFAGTQPPPGLDGGTGGSEPEPNKGQALSMLQFGGSPSPHGKPGGPGGVQDDGDGKGLKLNRFA